VRIGIDAGGTFTDFVVDAGSGGLVCFKLRSDPGNPAAVIRAGILKAAVVGVNTEIVHGSTVATNALLEHKGARTALVTTRGFEDLLRIGRQNRPELYNLTPHAAVPLVPHELQFGVAERLLADGTIVLEMHPDSLAELRATLKSAGVESVAICLLHSYANPVHELRIAESLGDSLYVSASHQITPEFREFERASTTVVNAYVGPLMQGYLMNLERTCPYPFWVMQSNGGFLTPGEAGQQAVRTILSGPAGGIVGAGAVAAECGYSQVLTLDMGGTSTDVSLVRKQRTFTTEGNAAGWPVRIPMLDIHTTGAGGGSIARIDSGGALRIGPESAGADPGPACYGRGPLPTITDAHVVLGRIQASQFPGGSVALEEKRSLQVVGELARQMGCGVYQAAEGIIRVGNANMERAIRVVSVERGEDARDFPLLAFGGCGGLHACGVAAALGIRTVILPEFAGALSALGMLLADRTRDYSASVLGRDPDREFVGLEARASKDVPGGEQTRFADLRYKGQSYELTVPWDDAETHFHAEHQRIYGFSSTARPVEIVAIRLRTLIKTERQLPRCDDYNTTEPGVRKLRWARRVQDVPVYQRESLPKEIAGPGLILDYGSTLLVENGWTCRRHPSGHLILTI
jgi:N-methylhydantoinase A/oxoprolinase/acetone carboxylase beta subunit